jgi:ketol-acid reductoisomerase
MITKKLAIIGFGSQGKAWALNLRDSGWKISILCRTKGSSFKTAVSLGFDCHLLSDTQISNHTQFALLIPDHKHLEFLNNYSLPKNSLAIYAHGQSLAMEQLSNKFDQYKHVLLAPKAIASEVRFQYETNGKLGAVYSVEACEGDNQFERNFIIALAKDLGINVGPYEVKVLEETNADLFSEQAILCSLIPFGAMEAYKKLREKGIPRELAYMECWVETYLIAKSMTSLGPEQFFNKISPAALRGSVKAREIFFDENYKNKIDKLWNEIENGEFYSEAQNTDTEELRQNLINEIKKEEFYLTDNELRSQIF